MSQSNPLYTLIAELSDIFGEWDDVMDTANELEQLLTDGMSQLAIFDHNSISDEIQQGLNEIKDKLEDTNFIDELRDQLQETLKDLKDQVNIDLESPFDIPETGDLSDLKNLIAKHLPHVPGVDFGPMTDAITKLMNLVDLPDLDVALRWTPGGSFPEGVEAEAQSVIQAATPLTTSNNINTSQNSIRGTSGTSSNNDGLQAMIPDWKAHEEAIEGLMTNLEKGIKELAIMDTVQASMDKLMPQIKQLKTVTDAIPILSTLIQEVGGQAEPVLQKVLGVFIDAFEDLKKLLISLKAARLPKDLEATQWYQLLTFGGGKEPGLLTLPCLVLALPLCFMSKAMTGKRPELGGVFQGGGVNGLKLGIGLCEIVDSIFGLILDFTTQKLKDKNKQESKPFKFFFFLKSLTGISPQILVIIALGKSKKNNSLKNHIFNARIAAAVGFGILNFIILFFLRFYKKVKAFEIERVLLVYNTMISFILTIMFCADDRKNTPKDSRLKHRSKLLIARQFFVTFTNCTGIILNDLKSRKEASSRQEEINAQMSEAKSLALFFKSISNSLQIARGGLMVDDARNLPHILATEISADNRYVDITFSEKVYSTNKGILNSSIFTLTLSGGSASSPAILNLKSWNNTSLKEGESKIRIFFSHSGIADGNETLTVNPKNGNSIYDSSGNVMNEDQSNNTTHLRNLSC